MRQLLWWLAPIPPSRLPSNVCLAQITSECIVRWVEAPEERCCELQQASHTAKRFECLPLTAHTPPTRAGIAVANVCMIPTSSTA